MTGYAIELTGGHVLLVDLTDLPLVRRFTWHAMPARKTFYAQSSDTPPLYLHRVLLQPGKGELVDHRNHNGLDNRRANLRLCNESQNKANVAAPASNTSGYKGVSWDRKSGKFNAYITVNYQRINLGYFTDPWLAAQAYNTAAVTHFGEFAYLNRPQSARDGGVGCAGTATH